MSLAAPPAADAGPPRHMANEIGMSPQPASATGWSHRCLNVARCSAIAVAVCAPFSTALTSLSAGVMLLAWLLSGVAHLTLRDALRQPAGWALALFLIIAATGLFHGVATSAARLDDLLGWRRLAYALVPLGLFGALLWKQRFVKAFVAAAAIGVAASFLSKWGWIPAKNGQAAGILLQNHAVQGITFALALLCVLQWARQLPWHARRWLAVLALALVANILFVTPARSGYLALLVVALTWAGSLTGWRRALGIYALIVAGMAVAYSTSSLMRGRVDQALNETMHADRTETLTSMGTRVLFYRTAWEMFQQRPIAGYGSGGFGPEYSRRVAERYTDWRATPSSDPHNIYLFIAVSHGSIGLAAFALFLLIALRSAPRDPMGWIGIGALSLFMATSLFSSHFRTFPEGHLLGMFLGVFLSRARAPTADLTDSRPVPV